MLKSSTQKYFSTFLIIISAFSLAYCSGNRGSFGIEARKEAGEKTPAKKTDPKAKTSKDSANTARVGSIGPVDADQADIPTDVAGAFLVCGTFMDQTGVQASNSTVTCDLTATNQRKLVSPDFKMNWDVVDHSKKPIAPAPTQQVHPDGKPFTFVTVLPSSELINVEVKLHLESKSAAFATMDYYANVVPATSAAAPVVSTVAPVEPAVPVAPVAEAPVVEAPVQVAEAPAPEPAPDTPPPPAPPAPEAPEPALAPPPGPDYSVFRLNYGLFGMSSADMTVALLGNLTPASGANTAVSAESVANLIASLDATSPICTGVGVIANRSALSSALAQKAAVQALPLRWSSTFETGMTVQRPAEWRNALPATKYFLTVSNRLCVAYVTKSAVNPNLIKVIIYKRSVFEIEFGAVPNLTCGAYNPCF